MARPRTIARNVPPADGTSGTAGDTMFHVKICGVTTAADARLAAAAGADAIGLNFIPGSPRRIDSDAAREVAAAIPAGVLRVGVFAGASAEVIMRVAELVKLDAIQLHGRLTGGDAVDPPGLCDELPLPVIRAVRLTGGSLDEARAWIAAARTEGRGPDMVVIDAAVAAGTVAGQLGGTGAVVDWEGLARAGDPGVPWALAGGLTPANVAEAILVTGARAVDTASGVEAAPGRKDQESVRAFVAAARKAWGG
jgi:phosphoribosylanthranilate isomerase